MSVHLARALSDQSVGRSQCGSLYRGITVSDELKDSGAAEDKHDRAERGEGRAYVYSPPVSPRTLEARDSTGSPGRNRGVLVSGGSPRMSPRKQVTLMLGDDDD
uniref:Uncharacterized protein n=1 Tax=Chromera velia CCMP2878 TaxID=1169474 RepID=A0A0G4HEQ1_9ALVE|eukprot:Cvel_6512.t1-p1 / transcript=Cvel_6512.t1 / gene=Cvel_6512 / organism=Chromera_velia_CCMP2878 / gene_product=hypothetical protein / transcript_product=hypothetical protein / location=Cvel_scaffold320:6875-9868(-) / protein_length=103 / sequence_SO=supercontig / SO=protein_coding / is_pseudo=false